MVTKPIPGFGELFRWLSFAEIGTSTIQSRAEGGPARTTYVFPLPGSTGAVRRRLRQDPAAAARPRHRPCNFVELLPRLMEK